MFQFIRSLFCLVWSNFILRNKYLSAETEVLIESCLRMFGIDLSEDQLLILGVQHLQQQ